MIKYLDLVYLEDRA